jgi:hypothetical protein
MLPIALDYSSFGLRPQARALKTLPSRMKKNFFSALSCRHQLLPIREVKAATGWLLVLERKTENDQKPNCTGSAIKRFLNP